MKHLKYLRYLIVHKWFVMLACFRRGLILQGIVHDWSKLLPDEWFPYAQSFYGPWKYSERPANVVAAFDAAWLRHQHRSPHHWQHWVLREDSGAIKVLPMPERYRLEMLADWDGAGRAITGKSGGTPSWYLGNRHKIQLHPETRYLVEWDLGVPLMERQSEVSS